MKAKDLIEKLQKFDPETEVAVCSCMYCGGSPGIELELFKRNDTVWDSTIKGTKTTELLIIEGND